MWLGFGFAAERDFEQAAHLQERPPRAQDAGAFDWAFQPGLERAAVEDLDLAFSDPTMPLTRATRRPGRGVHRRLPEPSHSGIASRVSRRTGHNRSVPP